MARAAPASSASVSIRYEEVTELLGEDATEAVLVELSSRLRGLCGERDTPARIGDGVFAMLRWDEPAPLEFAGRLVEQFTDCSAGPAELTFFKCTVGVGAVTAKADSPVEALRQAQIALSNARKQAGARCARFEPRMDQAVRRRKELETDLRRALEEDSLSLAYQPQVNARGAIVGAEALLRWVSPQHGSISPSVFIPLAESCGLSEAVGCFALRQAFSDFGELARAARRRQHRRPAHPLRPGGRHAGGVARRAPVAPPKASRSRSPRACCWPTSRARCRRSRRCAGWVSRWRSTTSEPATRA